MTCPRCGGSNVSSAGTCDRCGAAVIAPSGTDHAPAREPASGVDGTWIDTDERDEQAFHARLAAATPKVPMTAVLIAMNVAVFLVMVVRGVGVVDPSSDALVQWGANYGPRITAGEWWRLLTAAFVHAGIVHLAMNMSALWFGGDLAERLFGQPAFVVLYLVSGVMASLASVAAHPLTVSVGASGAIFGVYGGLIAYVVVCRRSLPAFIRSSLMQNLGVFVAYNVAFGLLNPRVDAIAHGGGLVAGLAAGAFLATPLGTLDGPRIKRAIAVGIAGLALAGFSGRRLPAYDDWSTALAEWRKSSAAIDKRMGEATGQLEARRLSPGQFADLIDHEWVPEYVRQQATIAALRLPAEQRKEAAKISNYLELKKEALALTAKAERSGRSELRDQAVAKSDQAFAAMLAIAPNPAAASQFAELTRQRALDRAFMEELRRLDEFERGSSAAFNQALTRLKVNRLPPREFAFSVERDVIQPWKTEQRRLAALAIPEGRKTMRDQLVEYMTVRAEAWQLVADGVRSNDMSLVTKASQRQAEAMKLRAALQGHPPPPAK